MNDLEIKNKLVINNEHIFKKYFPNIGELAKMSNARIEIEREFNLLNSGF